MPQRATKDTFATEDVSGAEVRRRVFAGDIVPDAWALEDGGEELKPGEAAVIGAGYEPVTGPVGAQTAAEEKKADKSAGKKE